MKRFLLSVVGVLLLSVSSVSLADSSDLPEWRAWPLGQRLNVGLGLYRPNIDTEVNLIAGPILGSISLEQNFGLDDSKSVPTLDLRWRFFKRHTLRFDYFELDRSGAGVAPANVAICPDDELDCIALPVEWPVNSFLDVQVFNLGYEYSIIFNEKMNWGVGLGLSAQDFKLGVLTDDPTSENPEVPEQIEVESSFTAPLPTLSTVFNYAFNDKWILDVGLNWLEIDTDIGDNGKFDGRIWAYNVGIRWQTFKNVGFFLAYTGFDLDVDVDDGEDFGGTVDYQYNGPRLGINAYF